MSHSDPTQEQTEDLYTLLDRNFRLYLGDKQFWRGLHAIDKEILPAGIYTEEPGLLSPSRNIIRHTDAENPFRGQKTLVIELQTEKMAIQGAKMLNQIFSGSGTKFMAQKLDKDGVPTYLIRTNMDMAHLEKLGVFCRHRFNREIRNPTDQEKLMGECQEIVTAYTNNTESEGWRAIPGAPAFVVLAGQHGVLRPPEHYGVNRERKEELVNFDHPSGNPFFARHVFVDVKLNKQGDIRYTPPYSMVFDTSRQAWRESLDDETYLGAMAETLGGNPAKKAPPAFRTIRSIGMGLGLRGLYHCGEDIIGLVGPAGAAVAATAFMVVTYVNHKWKLVGYLNNVRQENENSGAEHKPVVERVRLASEDTLPATPPQEHNPYAHELSKPVTLSEIVPNNPSMPKLYGDAMSDHSLRVLSNIVNSEMHAADIAGKAEAILKSHAGRLLH